jgi:hypothetical protein
MANVGRLTITERLAEFYRRLGAAPAFSTSEEAFLRTCQLLEQVEDEFSGVPKQIPPPGPGATDGRMYVPEPDFIVRSATGEIRAITRGHIVVITRDGAITITHRHSKQVEFQKPGATPP